MYSSKKCHSIKPVPCINKSLAKHFCHEVFCKVKTNTGHVWQWLWASAVPCVSAPAALQEAGTVKAKAIPTEVMEKMILTAQLELQYAKSSLFTCPASRSDWCVQGQQGELQQHMTRLSCTQQSNEGKGALENNSNKLLF